MVTVTPWIILVPIGAGMLWLARYFREKASTLGQRADRAQIDLNQFEFDQKASHYCCKSLVSYLGPEARCECFACKAERKEPVTQESQVRAAEVQEQACRAWSKAVFGK